MSHPPPTFLTLPVEVRLQIYAEVFSPWFRHKPPPFGDYPLGITSVCQQTRHESFPLVLIDPRHLDHGPSLWELTRQGEQKYLDIISAVTVKFDARTLLQFQKDLLLAPRDISETVPYSGEWWLATYQDRMSWLPRTPERPSAWLSLTQFLGLREIPLRAPPKSFIISTWEDFHKLPNLKKLKISFGKADNPNYPISTENEQRLLFEMISFTCPNVESLTVPINSSSPRLMLTSSTNFHNLEHLNQGGKEITFPKGAFPIVNQSLLKLDEYPQRWEAVMGGNGSGRQSIVTIIPPYEYREAFREPEPGPSDLDRRIEFDNH